MTVDASPVRPMRADGQRNREVLLETARTVFARDGIDASLQQVALESGVGRGSLYRHFPTREALFAAIMADQVEELRALGRAVLDARLTPEAVADWLAAYSAAARRYPGMSTHMAHGLGDETSPMSHACAPMKAVFAEIHARATADGLLRSTLTAPQVLMLVAQLPAAEPGGPVAGAFLDTVLRGLLA